MSTPTAAPPATPPVPPPGSGTNRSVGLIVGVLLLVVGLIAAVAVVSIISNGGGGSTSKGNTRPGDPANYTSDGNGALAETLKTHGVKVSVGRSQREVRDLPDASSSTVVVVSAASQASKSTSRLLRDKSEHAKRVVLLSPSTDVLTAWGVDALVQFTLASGVGPANCSVAGIARTDRAGDTDYLLRTYDDSKNCFGTALTAPVAVFPATTYRPEIVVLPQTWFTNDKITVADHAGIGLRVLGAGEQITWFAADPTDLNNDEPTKKKQDNKLKPDVPRWIRPMIALGLIVLLALMFWRGRRFGQLVAEPLPAVVKAAETTEARGRLYQASGDAQRAAAQLRERALRTIPRRLGVSRHAPVDEIVAAVSRATGRPIADVHALLVGPLPVDDAGLVQFATNLSTLEEEVRPAL
ncbi:MAG: hypothetical protein QM728_00220 [Gordonia sp. (in: high G+C Gram-positive bacteria)]|uniref:DUF4350 domain-containing protein n=1 Tax=Gordonia sp. (in: high G+C Gram-positive bacteria) TaxID=84139 RepID=UPI0039E251C5